MKNQIGYGTKKTKQRITMLFAANMIRTEKLPLLIIMQYQNPRCFKGVKCLLAIYKINHKTCMISIIFQEWLRDLDHKMSANQRKILPIMDNSTIHSVVNNYVSGSKISTSNMT